MSDSRRLSLAKAVLYRCFGLVVTWAVAWFVLREPVGAGAIAAVDAVAKIAAYYGFERAWIWMRRRFDASSAAGD